MFVVIDRKTRKLLSYISKHENITDDQIKEHFCSEMFEEIDVLDNHKYITTTITDYIPPGINKCSYSITPEGQAYIEHRRNTIIKETIGMILSAGVIAATLFSGCHSK